MKKHQVIIFLFLIFSINFTYAELYRFFEFAPDLGEKFAVRPQNQFIQKFIPFNDFISLIRIWIENIGSSARFNFELLDRDNNLIIAKEVTVPPTNFSWSGTILDIPLGNNIRIISGEEYKFKIFTQEQSNLKIFAFSLLDLLQNIEPSFNLPETIRPLIINNQEQDYSFKIALYEGQENIPPIISNLNYQLINHTSAKITFNANEPVRYNIFYSDNLSNTTSNYQVDYFENCPIGIRDCTALIPIQPNRNYYLQLIAYDYWENSSTAELTFNTFKNNSTNTTSTGSNNSNRSNSSVNYNFSTSGGNLNQTSQSQSKITSPNIKNRNYQSLTTTDNIKNQTKIKSDNQISKNEILKNQKENQLSINNKFDQSNEKFKKDYSKDLSTNQPFNSINKEPEKKLDYFKISILIISSLIILFVILSSIFNKQKK